MSLTGLSLHDVFTNVKKQDHFYAGLFDSRDFPYRPAAPIRCNYYSSMLFLEGSGFMVIDHLEHEVRPHRVFIFNNRQVIGWSNYENTKAYVLAFTPEIARSLQVGSYPTYFDPDEEELTLLQSIYHHTTLEMERQDHCSHKIMQSAAGLIYQLFGRHGKNTDVNDTIMADFRELICSDFSRQDTVNDYCRTLHISSKEINERCLRAYGLSAKQYIMDLRLTEAKRLLAFSDLTAAEIAYRVGFEDASYFTRQFRQRTQLTPSDFRKMYQISA